MRTESVNIPELKFLRRALDLSSDSLKLGGFPVAALLVNGDKEISHGLSQTETSGDVTAHGEIQAIRAARHNAVFPLTLYTSLEPCLMCLAASVWAGVNQIVYGCRMESVNRKYYINQKTAGDCSVLIHNPPKLIFIPDFEAEVVVMVADYEARRAIDR